MQATGEFVQAINFCKVHHSIYAYFLLRTVLVYAGVLCFVAIIKRFGVVVATTVTTVRKVNRCLRSSYRGREVRFRF